MTDCYYEDFKIGNRFVSGGMTMTEAGIIEFARQWDPQPFHTDVEFANKWTFGGLIASGLHTMAVTLKLWLEMGVFRAASLGSPGIGEVQFPRPVRPGDTLSAPNPNCHRDSHGTSIAEPRTICCSERNSAS